MYIINDDAGGVDADARREEPVLRHTAMTNSDQSPPVKPTMRTGPVNRLRSLFRLRRRGSLKESLKEVIEEHISTTSTDRDEKAMIHNVLAFSELNVGDVMIPRADVVFLDYHATLDDLKKIFLETPHTRFPVCKGGLDDVAGFIHVKDLVSMLCHDKPYSMDKMLRQALVVPPSMKTSALLVKMQMSRVHIAMVVDEYGGTAGLVTLEDLVEQIVGDIEDEYDREDHGLIVQTGKHVYEANARISLRALEKKLGLPIVTEDNEQEFDTLGGMIFFLLGRIPAKGEIAAYRRDDWREGLEFEVLDADPRRVKKVLIRKKP